MHRTNTDVEMTVAKAGWATGDAEICRTWSTITPAPPNYCRMGGGDIEVLSTMKVLGVPVAWDGHRAAETWCAKAGGDLIHDHA